MGILRKVEGGRKGRALYAPDLVCIDIQPHATTQAPNRDDIPNVGGFGDAIFGAAAGFLDGEANRFVREVEAVVL